MTMLLDLWSMAIYPKMAINAHFGLYGHILCIQQYGHVGYPMKDHIKTSTAVKAFIWTSESKVMTKKTFCAIFSPLNKLICLLNLKKCHQI